jgi:glutathione S-transferase
MGRAGDAAVADTAEREELPPVFDYLERTVPGDGGFLLGDAITLADIAIAGPFANFRHAGANCAPEKYPRTVAYVERILARPSFAPWIDQETALLASQPA